MPWNDLEVLLQNLMEESELNININGKSGSVNFKGIFERYKLNIPSPTEDGNLELSLSNKGEVNYSIGANNEK